MSGERVTSPDGCWPLRVSAGGVAACERWSQRTVASLVAGDPHATAVEIQAEALAALVAGRGEDPTERRRTSLRVAVDALVATGAAAAVLDRTGQTLPPDPHEAASALLVAALVDDTAAAEQVRNALRAVLVAGLDDELRSTMPLLDAFRGKRRGR